MKLRASLGGVLTLQALVACGSCPRAGVEVGDHVQVVVGEQSGRAARAPYTVSCDELGLGVGAALTGEVTKELVLAPPDAWPGHRCDPATYSGPVSIASEWTFELQPSDGGALWGGVFAARRGECTGQVRFDVAPDPEAEGGGFIEISFAPDPGAACPEQCASRHAASIEITPGEGLVGAGGNASGGSSGSGGRASNSGGADVGAGGNASGGAVSGSGGARASGGSSSGDGGGGTSGLETDVDERIQAFCEGDCSSFEQTEQCHSSQASDQEECWSTCYSAVVGTYHALCPDELVSVLSCTEEHPDTFDYTCDGTTVVWGDLACEAAVQAMRDCVVERQGS